MFCSALRSWLTLCVLVVFLCSGLYKNVLVLSLISSTWLKEMGRLKERNWQTVVKLASQFSVCALPVTSSWSVAFKPPTHPLRGLSHCGLQLWGLRSGSWARRTRVLGSHSAVFESKGFPVIQWHALQRRKKRGWRNEFPAGTRSSRHGFSLFRQSDRGRRLFQIWA